MFSETYEFAELDEPANVFVFSSLEACSIGHELLQRLGNADVVDPMLVGMDTPVHVVRRGNEVKRHLNLAGVTVVNARSSQLQTIMRVSGS